MQRHSVDYIYQRYSLLNFTGVLLSFIKSIPLILEYNGSEVWVDRYWSQKKIMSMRWLIWCLEWINIHYAQYIIVVSQPLKDDLIKRGVASHKILVNCNGVNTSLYNPALLLNERTYIRKQLESEDSFVFGFIGTFNKWHGIELLTAMIPAIIQQKEKVHFVLIGDGPLLAYLKNKLDSYIVEKKITCTGLISHHEAKKYLACCDAFLSPTQPNTDGTPFFGSPTKLFEYLSMAKPIIASDLDQVAEIIHPAFIPFDLDKLLQITDEVGFVVAPTETQQFIKAACKLVDLPIEDRKKMGENARSKALKNYDWNMHVEKIFLHIQNNKMLKERS